MKKRRNIAAAIVLSSMMAVSTCAFAVTSMTAFADHTLTVTDTEASNHTYYAYQIITGTKASGSDALGDMAWGTGVDSAKLIPALNAKKAELGINEITPGAAPSVVATELTKITDADKKNLLAKIFNETDVLTSSKTQLTRSSGSNDYSATLADGWYLVIDESTLNSDSGPTVKSANILQIVGDTTITTKHSVPTLEKKIVDGPNLVDANEANIGDIITYQIKVPVPDVTGYNKYYYNINDTLSAGLTYVGNETVRADNDTPSDTDDDINFVLDTDGVSTTATNNYYVTQDGQNIKIVFEDCINTFKNKKGDIIVTYQAKLNQHANATTAGNPNTASLTYSNSPNVDYSGNTDSKPDEPDSGQVTGKTPDDTVRTYTTSLKLIKVDGANPSTRLTGAEFEITGTDLNQVVVISKTKFVQDSNGTYYKLLDGTYTTVAPTDPTAGQYEPDAASTKYKMVVDTTSSNEAMTNATNKFTAIVDGDGYLTLKGIGAGTYTINETKAPDGYNLLTDNIEFTLSASSMSGNTGSVTWSATDKSDLTKTYFVSDNNEVEVTIQNNKGATLPTTGGIGTTLFYIIGGTLVAGSIVLLITKKRMHSTEE